MKKAVWGMLLLSSICLIIYACAGRSAKVQHVAPPSPQKKPLAMMGHTIQAGAFARVENAVRLTEKLKSQGLDATYFKTSDGLFKVRFGNFTSKEQARIQALSLQKEGVIEEFYIVLPEEYAAAKRKQLGDPYVREQIVKTAKDFIGVPYLWGGTNADKGFDCSGLTMTVYQLNGLDLPRHSAAQYDAGESIERKKLQKGDLVFFTTKGNGKVSHVGIYIGDDRFIHAPSRGKKICIESMSTGYYADRYAGAKNYF